MNPLLALALLVPAPQDSEIEPIDSAVIEIVLAADVDMCASLGDLDSAITLMLDLVETFDGDEGGNRPFIEQTFGDAFVAWALDMLEDSVGPNAALTPEAEQIAEDWAADCMVGV